MVKTGIRKMSYIAETSREALRVATETGLITDRVQKVYKAILKLGRPTAKEVDMYTVEKYGWSGAWKAVSELKDRGALVYGVKRISRGSKYRGYECLLTGEIGKKRVRIFPKNFMKAMDCTIRQMEDSGLREINKGGLLHLKKLAADEIKRHKAEDELKRRKAEGIF
jgi:hypothetical protein